MHHWSSSNCMARACLFFQLQWKALFWDCPLFRAAKARLFQKRWSSNSKNSPCSLPFTPAARAIAWRARAFFFQLQWKAFFWDCPFFRAAKARLFQKSVDVVKLGLGWYGCNRRIHQAPVCDMMQMARFWRHSKRAISHGVLMLKFNQNQMKSYSVFWSTSALMLSSFY